MRKQELHPRTAVINKSQKNKSKELRLTALAWLAKTFPEAFDNSQRIRPLKTGIMKDILEHADTAEAAGISKSKLREAVVLFTRRIDYLTCLKAREMRVDLNGEPAGEVSDEDAGHVAVKIKKRVEKSARNARKQTNVKPFSTTAASHYSSNQQQSAEAGNSSRSYNSSVSNNNFPVYPTRQTAYQNSTDAPVAPKKSTAVIVKQKASRQFDPDAVARLKAKLGLSREKGLEKEEASD